MKQHPELKWQSVLQEAITNPKELLTYLELDEKSLGAVQRASLDFALRVPRPFLNRINKGSPHDPLLLQILPQGNELLTVKGFIDDPLNETKFNPLPGLLHKYQGRVLLTVTGSCAVNCRYCFRRNFSYKENNPGKKGWKQVIEYLNNDPSIHEVIFSGGDPLLSNDTHLAELANSIANVQHIRTLRIHTRLPIVIPQRVTDKLLHWLTELPLRTVIVLHCNHSQEIDKEVISAICQLRAAKITLLNQAVLLKNINDNVNALHNLSEQLFNAGVLPYYLHLLDPVRGTAHFAVSAEHAQALITQLRSQLPGYLIPRLVYEKSGAANKIPLG